MPRSRYRPKIRPMTVVMVTWIDAHEGPDAQTHDDPEHAPLFAVSVGIVLRDDARGVTLTGDRWSLGSGEVTGHGRHHFIPREMVVSVRKVRIRA